MTFPYRLIGFTGTNGAGKGEAAAFFRDKGYSYFSLSDEIREELGRQGLEPTRDRMIRQGNELRSRFGPDILARRVMARVEGKAVIDSIRNPHEVAFLRSRGGFVLVAVDAPIGLRYARVLKRGRAESAETLQEFTAKEREEMRHDPNCQQLQECIRLADICLMNDGTLEEFRRKLEVLF